MNNACFRAFGGSVAQVDIGPSDRETASVDQMETCWSGPAVKVEVVIMQSTSQSAESSKDFLSSLSSEEKVTLMMPSLYNQGGSSPALEYLSF